MGYHGQTWASKGIDLIRGYCAEIFSPPRMRVLGPGVVIGSSRLRGILVSFATRGARRPVSRVLSTLERVWDGHSSGMRLAAHLTRPTRAAERECSWLSPSGCCLPPLFGLAPGGVYRAAPVAEGAVRSCRTISPLPADHFGCVGGLFSVALSLGSPPPAVSRHRIPVEPGLSSAASLRRRPSGRLAGGRLLSGRVASSRPASVNE